MESDGPGNVRCGLQLKIKSMSGEKMSEIQNESSDLKTDVTQTMFEDQSVLLDTNWRIDQEDS